MTSLWLLKRFEARIALFKSLDCPLALAAAGMNQRFTRYPPVINHNLGWCNYTINLMSMMFLSTGICWWPNWEIMYAMYATKKHFFIPFPHISYHCDEMEIISCGTVLNHQKVSSVHGHVPTVLLVPRKTIKYPQISMLTNKSVSYCCQLM